MNNSYIQQKVFQVSEITRLVKTVLEDEIGEVWIEGELSNVRQPSSGHYYFTIKDENSQIAAVLFRGFQRSLRFQPADGLVVRVFGLVSVYEKSGQYQVIVRQMEPAGKGALQAAFEALKKKLAAEGLFDPVRKKPVPILPRHIAVVTSPTGAAIRDILSVILRRFENMHIVLYPVRVQGAEAAADIAAAINELNAIGGFDVLIVGRGGGSLEDLWCFNEESVARAIASSTIPVISAVGHEIDFAISDFVADLRAATPSAAAELVIGRKDDFEEKINACSRRIIRAMQQKLLNLKNRFAAAAGSYVFREPRNLARQADEQINRMRLQMEYCIESLTREKQQRIDEMTFRIVRQTREWRRVSSMNIQRLEAELKGMNPFAVLERGYSITSQTNGRILKSTDQIRRGELVFTRLAAGSFESEVLKKNDSKN